MAGPSGKTNPSPEPRLRLDKWLWQARFAKTRAVASALIEAGSVRVNGTRTTRPGRDVTAGDVLTFPHGPRIRVIRILAVGLRRGPATEAHTLYLDLEPQAAAPEPLE